MTGTTPRGHREGRAERRAHRAAVEDPAVVLDAALRFLEPRARSEVEVRRRLTEAGYQASLVEATLTRLTDLGMLDDEAFARHWVGSRDRAHPRGTLALRRELRLKGITDDVVAKVLAERDEAARELPDVTDGDRPLVDHGSPDELAAERLLARRASALARYPDPRERRRRAYALLARSGFEAAICARVAARSVALPSDDEGGPDEADPSEP